MESLPNFGTFGRPQFYFKYQNRLVWKKVLKWSHFFLPQKNAKLYYYYYLLFFSSY